MSAAAAAIWIDTDGDFKIANFDYFEAADEHVEMLSESGLPAISLYREQLIEQASGGEYA